MSRGKGVGEVLKGARKEQGLTLEQVRSSAGIPFHYLEAIEEGRSALVADEAYVIPWLRRYADFLGFDEPLVVGRFLAEAERAEAAAPAIVALPRKKPSRGITLRIAVLGLAGVAGLLAWRWLVASGRAGWPP